eukprot:m.183051 g.183051  ORF g.183051 m.183051 type:complete len:185 (+) comp32146_c2_seq1:98-652(+)
MASKATSKSRRQNVARSKELVDPVNDRIKFRSQAPKSRKSETLKCERFLLKHCHDNASLYAGMTPVLSKQSYELVGDMLFDVCHVLSQESKRVKQQSSSKDKTEDDDGVVTNDHVVKAVTNLGLSTATSKKATVTSSVLHSAFANDPIQPSIATSDCITATNDATTTNDATAATNDAIMFLPQL